MVSRGLAAMTAASPPECLLVVEGRVQPRHELVVAAQKGAAEAQAHRGGTHCQAVAAACHSATLTS